MITLYSYPELFGVADNNPYGLKIFAFLKLCKLAFRHEHILDPKSAPRGQLPYIVDEDDAVGDSDTIIAHLIAKYGLTIDARLTPSQRDADLLIRRTLDDLYWVMSYSRWRDPRFWPLFRDALLGTHSEITIEALERAQKYNFERYHYQGIGRYEPNEAYARGLADLHVLASLIGAGGYLYGSEPSSGDAGLYGFIANIHFYDIDTPLKEFVTAHPNLVRHCEAVHGLVTR
ncbi:MAG TPA: glutathione S-transferase C-terminal domain-containing protein [Alphaproteobacteria bacterium]|nr:glutathione S-transferase C-terminal domain-containing protein [Alphaproteobacteria bacterium]